MNTKQKKYTLLSALFEFRYDGKYYDIGTVLRNAGVQVNNNEAFQIGQSLELEGLIQFAGTKSSAAAAITAVGVEYFEDMNSYVPIDSFSTDEIDEVVIRLDKLESEISKLQHGQEIIHDDIDELKQLLTVLGKNSWLDNLKGKFISWGLGKLNDQAFEIINSYFKENNLLN